MVDTSRFDYATAAAILVAHMQRGSPGLWVDREMTHLVDLWAGVVEAMVSKSAAWRRGERVD